MDVSSQAAAGQAVYSKTVLSSYDLVVLKISNRMIWRCPSPGLQRLYDRHVSSQHLDVGVGTGYFLDHCRAPTLTAAGARLALMDLNPNTLDFCARRLARYQPVPYRRNLLEPIEFPDQPFDSLGINYLLHCLPGVMASKACVFDHLRPLLRAGAVVFGSTLLQGGVQRSWAARRLMALYNARGIFSNQHDDLESLRAALTSRFDEVELDVVGCAAVFTARCR